MGRTSDTWLGQIEGLELPSSLKASLLAVTAEFAELSGGPFGDPLPEAAVVPEPYLDLGALGAGGMGQVRRARDPRLNRTLAIKVLHPHLAKEELAVLRFLEEAQVTAQLQHPAIPPVHEVGRLPDGRPYFAMLEVRGRTIDEAIEELHEGEEAPDTAALRRLLDAVQRAADAVAYAHSRGVVHRDLKPENVMLGPFGEVWVMDWGLTRVRSEVDEAPATLRDSSPLATRMGAVSGTPAFMAPEQARGEVADARSDVYALGGLLFTLLTGQPPYEADNLMGLLHQVATATTPPRPSDRVDWPVPAELDTLCTRALEPRRDRRYSDAATLAEELRAFLDGARARDRALVLVGESDEARARAEALDREAGMRADRARRALEEMPASPDERPLWPLWQEEDAAHNQQEAAAQAKLQSVLRLEAALSHVPELPEAHARLADHHAEEHRRAESSGDRRAAGRHETYLRRHGGAAWAAYLEGAGAITLHTDPPGAEVRLFRMEEVHRRMQPQFVRDLGRTPLERVSVERGSFLLELRAAGRAPVSYPVLVERNQHWDGVRPGASEPQPVYLPRRDELGADDVYVPCGWFWAGQEDPGGGHSVLPPTRLWCDGFAVRRFGVENEAFIAFLDDMIASGQQERALRYAPRYQGTQAGPVWRRGEGGRFLLGEDVAGHTWFPDAPVVLVDWESARAYAEWLAERSGQPWRLGWELQWEKAARGVDRRPFPWGWHAHPTWHRMRTTPEAAPGPARRPQFPVDCSPYGVRGMAGSAADWLLDSEPGHVMPTRDRVAVAPALIERQQRVRLRGGTYAFPEASCRVTYNQTLQQDARLDYLGLRLFRSLDPHAPLTESD